ncbi:four helix bundle protein, partial [Bacteroides cellulosilyticus]
MIDQRAVAFGVRIVKACRFLQENKKEFVLSKQVLRSETAIGAMVKESEFAESKA